MAINDDKQRTLKTTDDDTQIEKVDITSIDETGDYEDFDDETMGEEESTDDSELDESETEPIDEPETQKNVPVSKYVDEKKKRQDAQNENEILKIKLREFELKQGDTELEEYKKSVKERLVKNDMDEAYATIISEELAELKKSTRNIAKEVPVDKESLEIQKLKLESNYYDNADAFSDKIKENMKKFSISAKQAYNMVVDPVTRQKEMTQREISKPKANPTNNQVSNSSSNLGTKDSASSIKLSPEDQNALIQLQKQYGKSVWSKEKYCKVMKITK